MKNIANTTQFASPMTEETYREAQKRVVLWNVTAGICEHSMTVEQNKKVSYNHVPSDILTCHDAEVVCKYMCYFVLEVRRDDGKPYLPGMIQSLLS